MALKINSDQQRISASGSTPTGNWINATYSRSVTGVVTILSVAHGFIGSEKLYIDFTSGGEVDGQYTVTKVSDDELSFQSSNLGVISAVNTLAYKRVRSLSIQGDETIEMSVGTGANEKDALTMNLNPQNNIRVGVNTTDPLYELDVEGQIRTTRSIISDTAQVVNLDIQTIINPALDLRGPNLINYEDTDVTSPTDVSAAIADSGLPAKPVGNLTDMSPVTTPDTIFVDEVGAAFAKTADGLKPISSLNNYTLPELNINTSGITDFTADIGNLQPKFDLTLGNQGVPVRPEGFAMPDPLSLGDPTAGFEQNLANVSPGFKPDTSMIRDQLAVDFSNPDVGLRNVAITKPMSYGEKIAQNIKDSFSAEKVVDGVMDFGTSIAGSLAMGAIQGQDETIIPGTPSQTLSGVGAGMAYQPFQAALVAADINPLAAYQNLTYGSGDVNAAGGELFRQQILPIQVG